MKDLLHLFAILLAAVIVLGALNGSLTLREKENQENFDNFGNVVHEATDTSLLENFDDLNKEDRKAILEAMYMSQGNTYQQQQNRNVEVVEKDLSYKGNTELAGSRRTQPDGLEIVHPFKGNNSIPQQVSEEENLEHFNDGSNPSASNPSASSSPPISSGNGVLVDKIDNPTEPAIEPTSGSETEPEETGVVDTTEGTTVNMDDDTTANMDGVEEPFANTGFFVEAFSDSPYASASF